MKSLLIFNYIILTIVSLYLIITHLFKKDKNISTFIFVTMMFMILIEFLLIISVNIHPYLTEYYFISGNILLLPVIIFILMFLITLIFPSENIARFEFIFAFLLLLVVSDVASIFYIKKMNVNITIIDRSLEVIKNRGTIIQSGLILFFIILVPVPLILKMRFSYFKRIRTTIIFYLSGLFFSYTLTMISYAVGVFYLHLPVLKNPFIPATIFLIMAFTSHLIYNLKKNDFQKFYKVLFIYSFAFFLFIIPVYFFLKFYPLFARSQEGGVYIKSAAIFVYLVAAYRLISPFIVKFQSGKLQSLMQAINKTLLPVNELKKFSDMDTFWAYITNDNFHNLKYTLRIKSAYFMLINRKDHIFQLTSGYGPELNFQVLDENSVIAKYITSRDGVFEKSFLVADMPFKQVNSDIFNFFNDNGIEISMAFNNMSGNIIGFLLLGGIEGNKSYTSDYLAALEIFRIKIQNLLITGMILDEVTAEQVAEHDKIVVSTVKKRIIPEELPSIPGIRIGSFYIDNSSYGGDYFDSVKISAEKTIIFIAETSYSGIDSALIGMELFSILHSRTFIFNSPEKVLNTMNQVIRTSRLTNSFARCSCMIVSSDGNFSYANASHNQLLIFEPDTQGFTEVETENIPLGMEMNHRYSFTTGKLKEGAIGILYSDGLFTSCNESGETFPLELLKDKVMRNAKETSPIISREIYMAYRSFIGEKEQINDVTVIVFKKVKTENEQH